MALKFPSELASRGTVKVTDKLIIHNIDTGATEYTTVSALLAAIANTFIDGYVGVQMSIGTVAEPTEVVALRSNVPDAYAYPYIGFLNSWGDNHRTWMNFNVRNSLHNKVTAMTIDGEGNVIIGAASGTSKFQVVGLTEYADNAAAVAGGLTEGAFYRTADVLKIVHA